MSKTSLHTLIDLARDARNEAAQLLANERSNSRLAEQQLQTLEQYRNEYRQQLQQVMDQGLDLASLQNYQAFLSSLDKAIAQAHQALKHQEMKVERCQQFWQQEQRRLTSYDTLQQRRDQQDNLQAQRRERRDNDEVSASFASRERLRQGLSDQ